MTATLGADLILNVNRCSAELDHRLDGARHVEKRGAEASVHVHQQRQITYIGNASYISQYIVQTGNTQIRHAQRPGCNAATRQVDGLETRTLGQQRVVGVDRAHHLQRVLACNCITETLAWTVLIAHDSPRGVAVCWALSW